MYENVKNFPIFEEGASCSTVHVTYEITRESLISAYENIAGQRNREKMNINNFGFGVILPDYKDIKRTKSVNKLLESDSYIRNLMIRVYTLTNGLTYLTFTYKFHQTIDLTYSGEKAIGLRKAYDYAFGSKGIGDISHLTKRLDNVSNKIIQKAKASVIGRPVFAADIICPTLEDYFYRESNEFAISHMIYRANDPVEVLYSCREEGRVSRFYIPIWFTLPIFGFYIISGRRAAEEDALPPRTGIDIFGTAPHTALSFCAKAEQDFKDIKSKVDSFFNRNKSTDLKSLDFISTISDQLHSVDEKVSILIAGHRDTLLNGNCGDSFGAQLHKLKAKIQELLLFIQARHPLKESILQVKQIRSNNMFSTMFAVLAGVQILIAIFNVDWTDSGIKNNPIYQNIRGLHRATMEIGKATPKNKLIQHNNSGAQNLSATTRLFIYGDTKERHLRPNTQRSSISIIKDIKPSERQSLTDIARIFNFPDRPMITRDADRYIYH